MPTRKQPQCGGRLSFSPLKLVIKQTTSFLGITSYNMHNIMFLKNNVTGELDPSALPDGFPMRSFNISQVRLQETDEPNQYTVISFGPLASHMKNYTVHHKSIESTGISIQTLAGKKKSDVSTKRLSRTSRTATARTSRTGRTATKRKRRSATKSTRSAKRRKK